MKKHLTEKTTYEPNDLVKVTVQNKPVEGGKYERKVSITVNCGFADEKLQFSTDEDIEKWVADISFEDPQQALGV